MTDSVKAQKKKKLWIILSIAFVMLFVIALKLTKGEKEIKYKSTKVTIEPITVNIQTSGSVLPQNRLEIKSSIAGRIVKIFIKEGELVKKNQVLATMSSTERAALLDAASAKGQKELEKWEKLYKATPIIAPINGTVIAKNVEPGQTIGTSDAIFVMSDRLVIKAQVDETDIAKVKKGQVVKVTLDAYQNETIEGTVDQIAYEAKTVNSVTMYEVEILPKNVPPFMRSGMTVTVEFLVAHKDSTLVIPSDMLHQENGTPHVYITNANGKKPKSISVETGLTDGKKVEIISGLKEGDTVMVQEIDLTKKEKKSKGAFSGGR